MATRQEIADRLDDALAGRSSTAVAKRLGVSVAAISRWRSGQRFPDAEALARLCQEFAVSADYLLGLGRPTAMLETAEGIELVRVPLLKQAISAGNPHVADDEVAEERFFLASFGRRLGDDPVLVKVERSWLGESMLPDLKPGALIALDRGPGGRGITLERFRDGKVYAVRVDDGLTLKQVSRDKTSPELLICSSFNRAYAPFTVRVGHGEPLGNVLVGRMVWKAEEDL